MWFFVWACWFPSFLTLGLSNIQYLVHCAYCVIVYSEEKMSPCILYVIYHLPSRLMFRAGRAERIISTLSNVVVLRIFAGGARLWFAFLLWIWHMTITYERRDIVAIAPGVRVINSCSICLVSRFLLLVRHWRTDGPMTFGGSVTYG